MSSQSPRQSPTPAEEPENPDASATPEQRETKVDKRKAPEEDSLSLDLSMTDESPVENPMKKPRLDISDAVSDAEVPSEFPFLPPLPIPVENTSDFLLQGDISDVTISINTTEENRLLMDDSDNGNSPVIFPEDEVKVATATVAEEVLQSSKPSLREETKESLNPNQSSEVVQESQIGMDSDSDKFFTRIREKEEGQQQQPAKEEEHKEVENTNASASAVPAAPVLIAPPPVSDEKEKTKKSKSSEIKAEKKSEQTKEKSESSRGSESRTNSADSAKSSRKKSESQSKSSRSSSTHESSSMENSSLTPKLVEFSIQVYDGKSHTVIYENRHGRIKSDLDTVGTFLKNHHIDITSLSSTGYSADISSPESGTFDFLNTPQKPRTSSSSLGSSIPRPSNASTFSRPSIVGVGDKNVQISKKPLKEETRPPKKRNDAGPMLSSTRITEYKSPKSKTPSSVDKKGKGDTTLRTASRNKTPVTNGGDHSAVVKSKTSGPAETGRGRRSKAVTNASEVKTPTSRPHPNNSTPKSSEKASKKSTPGAATISLGDAGSILLPSVSAGSLDASALPSFAQSESFTTSTSNSTSASTSEADPDILKKIKIEPLDKSKTPKKRQKQKAIGAAKGLVEKFSAPGLSKSATLWGAVGVGESVFARWRDKSYYSGTITSKGLNDTWNIHFDDNMEDVASEAHILPIKILGVGTRSVYCPASEFKPEDVIVAGQRFGDEEQVKNEYAVLSDVDGRHIDCQRVNLVLEESEARELRKLYQSSSSTFKTADVNLGNIVSERRRRVGAGSLPPSEQIRKMIADATLDASGDEHSLTAPWTPTPKKLSTPGSRRESATSRAESTVSEDSKKSEDHKRRSPASNFSTPAMDTSTAGSSKTPSIHSGTPNDTPQTAASKDMAKKEKKRKEKPLFHGMQFFLTASGGGDPTSSGTSGDPPVVTYDKDEYRDTIEKKGGHVVGMVGRENKGKYKTYLISDSHARTVKYIYCLAAGIPCVSSLWIGECLQKNTIVDWKPFELNAGWSLETASVIPAHQKKPLKDLRIYVTSETDELYNYWKPVLTAAEAHILKPVKTRKEGVIPNDAEILVSDTSCTHGILEAAHEKGIPAVKPEWLVQTIIMGEKAEFAGHEKYYVGLSDMENCEEDADDGSDDS